MPRRTSARSLSSAPRAYEAVVQLPRSVTDLAEVLRWVDHEVVRDEPESCAIRLQADLLDGVVSNVVLIAVSGHLDVVVEDPPEIAAAVAEASKRFARPTGVGVG